MKKSIYDSKSLFLLILVVIFGFSGFVLATPGDMDGDGYVNLIDLSLFADQWLADDCISPDWCGGADINHSNNVDFNDFAFFAQNWSTAMPIWSDEFDGTSVDTSKWNIYNKADGTDSWFLPANVTVSDGTLKIANKEESAPNGGHWTGGYIDTAPASSAHPQYKYLVARVRHSAPDTYIWATWWTVGWVNGSLVWPPELDICEVQGGPGQSPGQTYHWNVGGNDTWLGCSTGMDESQWHTYGVYWTATTSPVFYVDGVLSCSPGGPYTGALMPMKLKLTSSPNSRNRYSGCPLGDFEVDYVRVYDNPPPLPPPPPGIVSQYKVATASSEQSPAANANDGSLSTRWAAINGTYPQWWKVDLGASYNLTRTDVNWYSSSSRAYKYKIEVSADDITYTTVVDNTGNTTYGDTSDSFTAIGRYVRITVTGCTSGSAFASAYEIKVYGN